MECLPYPRAIVFIVRIVLVVLVVTIVVFIANHRHLFWKVLPAGFTFAIDLDYQLNFGKRRLQGRVFIQSTNSSGDNLVTVPLRNLSTSRIATPIPALRLTGISQRNPFRQSINHVSDHHQVQYDLQDLPLTWSGLQARSGIPLVIDIHEPDSEFRAEVEREDELRGLPSTPSFLNTDYWESHSARD